MLQNLIDNIETGQTVQAKKAALIRATIVKTVFDKEMVSAGELSKMLNLSFPTLNSHINDLVNDGILVAKDKGESIGGRKPILYKTNQSLFQILCIEIERFSIRLVVLDNNYQALFPAFQASFEIKTHASDAKELVNIINQYFTKHQVNLDAITAIGINMPGLVDTENGITYTFYTEVAFNLKNYLEGELNKYVCLINDVKVAAYSELNYGAAKKKENVLVILMDWGIGLGIIANGKVYMGNNGFSGEMGHIIFEEEGDLCYCGKRGCLETVASGIFLVNQAQANLEQGKPTLLRNLPDLKNLQPQQIIQVATEGDQFAIDLISSLGKNLGKAISLLIQLLNPESVVLSGKFARAGSLITIPIQQGINTYTMNAISKNCEVVVSSLDRNGYAKGLTHFVFDKYFNEKILNNK